MQPFKLLSYVSSWTSDILLLQNNNIRHGQSQIMVSWLCFVIPRSTSPDWKQILFLGSNIANLEASNLLQILQFPHPTLILLVTTITHCYAYNLANRLNNLWTCAWLVNCLLLLLIKDIISKYKFQNHEEACICCSYKMWHPYPIGMAVSHIFSTKVSQSVKAYCGYLQLYVSFLAS